MNFFLYQFFVMPGSINMAIDKFLFEETKKNGSINLRFYLWSKPTISIGKNQKLEEAVNIEFCKEKEIDVVRRPTGGRALLHHKEITYFISGKMDGKNFPKKIQENYIFISEIIKDGLNKLKIPAEIKKEKTYVISPRENFPCFYAPSSGEIVANGKKIAGSAMHVENDSFLLHGSILIDFEEGLQENCFKFKEKFFVSKMVDFLDPLPTWKRIIDCFKDSFEEKLKIEFKKKNFGKKIIREAKKYSGFFELLKN